MFLHPAHTDMDQNVVIDLAYIPGSETCFYTVLRSGALSVGDIRTSDIIQWTDRLDMIKPAMMKTTESQYELFISARRSEIKLWDVRGNTLKCVQWYSKHKAESLPIGFDLLNYGKYLATGSDDGCVYIYAVCTGHLVRKIKLGNGHVQSCCAESVDAMSFYVTFNNARCLGVVDTEASDIEHQPTSVEDITEAYGKMAWNAAVSMYTVRLVKHVELLLGDSPYSHNDWFSVLQASQLPESQELLSLITTEYQRQFEVMKPQLNSDLHAYYLRRNHKDSGPKPRITRKSSQGPLVRKDVSSASTLSGRQNPHC